MGEDYIVVCYSLRIYFLRDGIDLTNFVRKRNHFILGSKVKKREKKNKNKKRKIKEIIIFIRDIPN